VNPVPYDGIVIIGGTGAQDYLWGDPRLEKLVRAFDARGSSWPPSACPRSSGGCRGARGEEGHGLPHPIVRVNDGERGAKLVHEHVVVDGRIVTADGPPAARKFGEAVASTLRRMMKT